MNSKSRSDINECGKVTTCKTPAQGHLDRHAVEEKQFFDYGAAGRRAWRRKRAKSPKGQLKTGP